MKNHDRLLLSMVASARSRGVKVNTLDDAVRLGKELQLALERYEQPATSGEPLKPGDFLAGDLRDPLTPDKPKPSEQPGGGISYATINEGPLKGRPVKIVWSEPPPILDFYGWHPV